MSAYVTPSPLRLARRSATVLLGGALSAALLLTTAPAALAGMATPSDTSGVQGVDVSSAHGTVDWEAVHGSGVSFAYLKATEGASHTDPQFARNHADSRDAGLVVGAYHSARPSSSSTEQAHHFAANGGAWSADDQTLPGAVGLEHSPSGSMCHGLTTTQMREWITDFHAAYKARTTRDVVLYTTASWWQTCTGGWSDAPANSPLWAAHWGAESPTLPPGFAAWTFWQYTGTGQVDGISGEVSRSKFHGSTAELLALANNTR